MSRYFSAEIKENLPLNKNHNLLTLVTTETINEPLPGQFFMIGVSEGYDPLLKRAFSMFRRTHEGFQLMYRVKGKGTSLLKAMQEGASIRFLGPLGNSYPHPYDKQIPLIIAGGVGIASVFSHIEKLSGKACVFYGARNKEELFMLDELRSLSKNLIITTDDGSAGERGTVCDALKVFLRNNRANLADYVIYSCGPFPMLREVAQKAVSENIPAYVSLEEHMACGLGACLGCVVKAKSRNPEFMYKRVCKEGPVFDVRDIEW